MSTTYSGSNSFPTSITEPTDGDAITGASVQVPVEGLADRTVYLRTLVETAGGPKVLRTVPDIASLRLLSTTGLVAESICMVTGFGLYSWSPLAPFTDDGIFCVTPITSPATGRWLNLYYVQSSDGGLAILSNIDRKISPDQARGWRVDSVHDGQGAAGAYTFGSNWKLAPVSSTRYVFMGTQFLSCLVGDALEYKCEALISYDNQNPLPLQANAYVAININQNGTNTTDTYSICVPQVKTGTVPVTKYTAFGTFLVTATGTTTIQMAAWTDNQYQIRVHAPSILTTTRYR